MSSAAIPIEQIQSLMPLMSADELMYCLRLAKQIETLKPAEEVKPATPLQMVEMESSLTAFFVEAWKVLEPGHPLLWSWHYELLCEYLTLVAQKKLRRLIINVPPRTAKSNLVTKAFPVWMWLQDPTVAFLFASYSKDLSTDHSVHRRNLIQSNWHQALWGEKYQMASDRNLTTQFSNDRTGTMIATSTGSGAEGKGCDIAILDDPMSSEQALSDAERTTSNRWIANTLKQRLNNPSTAAIILIMQRLHELDTTGYVEQEDPGVWTKIEIPLVAEKDEVWQFPISGKVVQRKRGEVLQAERFTPPVVEEKRRARLVFSGQYQQHPAPLEGNLIKRSEVRYYGGRDPVTGVPDPPLPDAWDLILISADCSFKDLTSSDYVAIGDIGVKGKSRVILNVINAHLDADGAETEILRRRAHWVSQGKRVGAVLIEDKANGSAVIARLKRNIPGVIAIEPEGGKISRFFAAAPEWQAGDWAVDRTAAWCEPFIHQITQFPLAANDDMADMMSQAAIWLGAQMYLLGLVDFYKGGKAEQIVQELTKKATDKANGVNGHDKVNGHANGKFPTKCDACGSEAIRPIPGNQVKCDGCGKQFGPADVRVFHPKRTPDVNTLIRGGRR